MSNSGSLPVDPSSGNASLNAGLNTTNDGERISRGLVSVEGSINSHSTLKESDSVQNPPMNMQGFATGHPIAGVNGYNISSEYVPMQPQPPQGLELSHNGQQRMDTEPHGLGMPLQPLLSMGAGSANVPGSVMRAPTLAGFQMSGLQGGQMPMSNVNIAQGGPLLSSGITNAKNMQAHNLTSTESFVAMQPQGMMHTQQQLLPSASGAMTAGNPVMTSSPHTVGLSQPQNIPLNTFLTSSHNLAPQQVNMSNQQQAPSLVLQQPGGQQGQPLLMSVDGMNQHGGGQQVPQMQNAQQWMQMRPNNIAPGGNAPPQMQMMQQQQQHGMPPSNQQGQGQGQSQPQMQQYHMQNPGQGQQMQQYGQPQQQQMQGQVHQQQQQMPPPHQQQQQHQVQQQQQQQQMHLNVIPNPQQQQQQMQQQQQPQSQASFAGTKFNTKLWHSGEHAGTRNLLTEDIIKLLRTRRPNATEDWYEKLPHMARRLEDALYHEADSLLEYSDSNTLKHRLQNLALSMGNNKSQQQGQQPVPQNKGAPGGPPQQQQQQMNPNQMRQQQQQYQQQMQQKPYPQQPGQPQNQQMQGQFNPQQQQQFQQMRTAQAAASQYPQQGGNPQQPGMAPQQGYLSSGALEYQQQQLAAQQMQMQGGQQQGGMHLQGQPMMHSNMQYGNQGQMMMNGNPQGQVVNPVPAYMINQGDAPNNVQMGSMQYAPMQGGMNRPGGMPNVNIIGMQPQQGQMMHGQGMPQGGNMHPTGQMMQGGNPNAQLGPAGPGGHTEEHRKQVLKQQQQRLLLLRHASKCPHDNGRCPVTPHCWSMKQLWKHIMSCKDQECKIPHCVSSRYVLSHYSKCKEPTCPVCGPVREAIKRNYERSRDIVKATRTSSGSFTGQMPAHAPPQRDEPPAKRQKKKDAGKDKADERHMQPTLVIPNRPRPPPRSVYPLDPISCAIYCFSAEDIQAHFKSIHEGMKLTVAKIREMCKPIVEELYKVPHAHGIFGTPVDPVALGLPDYFDVIKVPMDLGTVMKKLSDGSYRDLHHFVIDVHLTFDNAMNYNPKNSDVYVLAKSLKKDFDIKYRQKVSDFEKNLAIMRENPEACLICGEISLKFEPPVYYCNGTCAQRIRRNAVFFSNNTNTYHWCNPCFNNLKENEVVRLPDCSISKGELLRNKKKHIEESEEGWVQCEGGCQRWVHQVCSLFNARRNISDEVSYVCPLCIQAERQKRPDALIVQPTTKKMSAADLPLTILSQFLEKRIYKRLAIAYKENAQKLGVSENDVEKCPPLILRQVSSQDKMHTVREGVYNRYKEKGYPTDFPCRSKCLVLFQNIDGQDVVLFGMYVYEYGHKCPQPNQRRVYISYLDSVHYLRPKQYRTLVYHEILISYLDYVRARGFHTAHIWACPPQKGDDYILYVHPPDQKTPKPQILRVWYDEMIKRCVERGIVCEYTDFHTEYLVDHSNDATVLPYFEGDYWVNEAEVIIKNLKTGVKDDDDDGGGAGAKSKRKSKSKRLVRTDQVKPISLGKSERDPVMAKLASIIEPMKDTFFVARLHPREYAAKCAENRTAELTAANSTGESTDQQEEKLREEALTGSDVQMPAGAAAPDKLPANGSSANLSGAQGEDEQGGDKDEQQSGAEDQMDDDDDDFGKAASAIALPGNDTGSGDAEGDGDGSLGPARRSISTMQFSDFTALQRAESFTSQAIQELEGKGDGNFGEDGGMRVEESPAEAGAAASTETTAAAGRGTRSTRGKPKSDVKVKSEDGSADADEGDGAMDTADSPTKVAAVKAESDGTSAFDGIDASKLESKEDQVITSGIKAEKYASHMHASPAPTKSSGHVKNTAEPEAAAESAPTATASEETKVKSEDSSDAVKSEDGEEGAKSPRTPGVVVAPVLIMAGEDMPDLKDDTEDVDDVQENEHFETRQSFLNLCQGNHYQFDQLRRAKHTSMMVLYHLHNPDAPKFVPSCNLCHIDILTGYRHHCDTCEIDYCQNCVSNSVMRIHPHPLRPMAIANSAPQQLTEEQRRERARSVQLHMQLLQHAANCVKCESKNCHRMKEFLKHDGVCTVKTVGGCRLCARISNLLNIHARSCRVEGCKVPHCLELREQMRKLTLRQQQMDDRRRQNMNSEYGRAGGSTGTEAPLEDA